MTGPHHHNHAEFHRRHAAAANTPPVERAAEAALLNEARMASPAQGVDQPTLPLAARAVGDKPVGPDITNIAIACGIAIPLVLAISVLLFLHRRSVKRQRLEDANDKYKSMDFGLGEGGPGGKRRSNFFGKEKDAANHNRQLSLDMNLSSPYLLPPTVQHSRESLARSFHKDESDPYRLVPDYASEVGSIRSFPNKRPDRGSSVFSGKTGHTQSGDDGPQGKYPPRQKSMQPPPSPLSPLSPLPPIAQRAEVTDNAPAPEPPAKNDFRFNDNEHSRPNLSVTIPEHHPVPQIQEPPQAASKMSSRAGSIKSMTSGPQSGAWSAHDRESGALPLRESPRDHGLGIMGEAPYPGTNAMPVIVTEDQPSSNGFDFNLPAQPAQHGQDMHSQEAELYPQHPQEHDYPHSAGLAIPEKSNHRLSVGFRPLPPDEYLDSEDPEFRANRIRSFYKEYFDDSVKQDSSRPPPLPQQHGGPQHGGYEAGGYYEDYDANYMGGEGAYFDPDSNTFVMPYAQPVTRRAMTPPPSNRRPMPGPRAGGPHRGPPGPRGPQGRPRAGSTMSAAVGRPRAGSTMSGRFGHPGMMSPRPGSSASNQPSVYGGGKPRKPITPPAALTTLPTPSKLKDDSFAIFNAADFAPPPNFKDQAQGRCQSPLGERRPYLSPTMPAHSPLVSSYDEVAALPSPHVLRKSSTFTALDFAPPRRFKDPDTMSDAGSIRSNHSGISSRNAIALRNGAGRVSRLPGDTVFTEHDMQSKLKPQWDMGR